MENANSVVTIIDDDTGTLDALALWLKACGHEVAAYTSAKAFLDDGPKPTACLIVDYNMPGMTGLQFAASLRREGAAIPFLLLTGGVSATIVSTAAQLEVEVLAKPINRKVLLKFIEEALTKSRQAER